MADEIPLREAVALFESADRDESMRGMSVLFRRYVNRRETLITTSEFTRDAREYVERIQKRIVLIDGVKLAEYMMDFNVGVSQASSYVVKKIDLDYFEGEE